jgi:hypothetical protein
MRGGSVSWVMPMSSMKPCSLSVRKVSSGCCGISLRMSSSLRRPSTRISALRSRGGRRWARVSISECPFAVLR